MVKDNIKYSEFEKLDLRVGMVVEVEIPEWSDKLLRFKVDFGSEIGIRIIFSGIRKWYSPKDFKGKKYVFVANMEPKKIGDEVSQGMMLLIETDTKPLPLDRIDEVGCGVKVR